MSIANQLKTINLDPVLFNQRRCEFRIPQGVYLSNLRLGNIGATVVGSAADSTNAGSMKSIKYPFHSGAYSILQKMTLLNGNVEIASLNNVGDYLSFSNMNRTNANSHNVARYLNKSRFGFTLGDVNDGKGIDTNKGSIANFDTIGIKDNIHQVNGLTSDAETTPQGWLDLKQVLPFLKATPVLNGTELRDLRLVIEWVTLGNNPTAAGAGGNSTEAERITADKAYNKVLVGHSKNTDDSGSATTGPAVTNFKVIQPVLCMDEIIDNSQLKKVKNVPITYINLDSETVHLDDATGKQVTQQRLRGFNSKFIRRLLTVNKPHVAEVNEMLGQFQSSAMHGEKVQFLLNGEKLLPYKGVENENQKLAMLNDTWGSRNQPQGSHMPSLAYSQNVLTGFDHHSNVIKRSNTDSQIAGKLSYGGYNINQRVDELILEHERDALPVTLDDSANPIIAIAKTVASEGIVGFLKVTTRYAVDTKDKEQITVGGLTGGAGSGNPNAWVDINGTYDIVTNYKATADGGGREELDKYRTNFGYGYILNKDVSAGGWDITACTATDGVYGTVKSATQTEVDSKKAMDVLFWGEVVTSLKVQNNQVSISY
jgi:hypothetical protein